MRYCFLILLLALGCTSSKDSGSARIVVEGTSDSGGGNGIENRVYEAYIVKTEELPAYKQLIAPKIARMMSLSPRPDLFMPLFKRWLLYKTWYIAPVELNTISKDVIGVSFSNDQTEQLAIQTQKSVWINDSRFNRMSMQDQAALIIHEMVMSLYYLKFKSWEEVCAEGLFISEQCADPRYSEFMHELFPGTTPRPFDAADYENMRAVVGEMLGSWNFNTYQELDEFLIRRHFDRRFTFGMGIGSGTQQEEFIFDFNLELPMAEMHQVLESAKLLNQVPDRCRGYRFQADFNCYFSFRNTMWTSASGYQMPILLLSVRGEDSTRVNFEGAMFSWDDHKIPGSSVTWVSQRKKMNYFVFHSYPLPTPGVVGTFFRSMTVITIQDLNVPNPPHTLLGLISVPGIVTEILPDKECRFAKPSPTSAYNDSLLVFSRHLSDFEQGMLRLRGRFMPPVTTCKPFGAVIPENSGNSSSLQVAY